MAGHKLSCGHLSIDIFDISLSLLCSEELDARLEVLHGLEDMTLGVGERLVQDPILLVASHPGRSSDPLPGSGSSSLDGEDLLPEDVRLLQLCNALLQRLGHLHPLEVRGSLTCQNLSAAARACGQLAKRSAHGCHCCVLGRALLRCGVAAEHGGWANGAKSLTRGLLRVARWSESHHRSKI